MNKNQIKSRILSEIENKQVPDTQFLFSKQSLEIIPDVLNKLLEKEKKKFLKLLETNDKKINFSIFEDEDRLSYLFSLINHLESVNSSEKVRKIIDDFRAPYIDFGNEVAFSKRFYDMHVILRNS